MTAPDAHNRSAPRETPGTTTDVDALDAWLESITSPRHVARSRDISPNGHGDLGASLPAAAQRFHARLARAEHEAQPDVPVDAIWEKIMASPTIAAAPDDALAPRHVERSRDISPRRDTPRAVPAWLAGSHWLVSAAMVAAVVVGIVALYGSFAGAPGGSGDDAATNSGFAMASPGETGSTPEPDIDRWLAPITRDECNVEPRSLDEVGDLVQSPGQVTPREYDPVAAVEASVATDVVDTQRAWVACYASEGPEYRRGLETLRYIAEIQPVSPVSPSNVETFDDWVAWNETLRDTFLDPAVESYSVESGALPPFECQTENLETGSFNQWSNQVVLPEHLVQLSDGRVGGPVSWIVGEGAVECLAARPTPPGGDQLNIQVRIFAEDPSRGGRWALDEEFSLCLTECNAYYADIGSFMFATPEAVMPAASLQPITPDECDVEPLSDEELSAITQGEPGDEAERSYAPTGPAHDALAQEVASADRAWQSCYVNGSAGQRAALQSSRLTRDGPGVQPGFEISEEDHLAQLDRFDATRELGDGMLSGNWRDYFVASDRFDEATPWPDQVTGFIATVPNPEQAFQLADGRVAVPIVQLVPSNAYPFTLTDADDTGFWYIEVHILAQDPARDGRWVFDESIGVCMGDCVLARADTVEYMEYLGIDVDGATPAATPQTRRDGGIG